MTPLFALDDPSDGNDLADAITTLGQFPQAIMDAIVPIASVRFGPYEADYSCCTSYFIFCIETTYVTVKMDFGDAQTMLGNALGDIRANSYDVLQQLGPLHQWMDATVPATSQQFQGASVVIAAAEAAGPSITPQQRQDVLTALGSLSDGLTAGLNEVQPLVGQLAQSLQATDQCASAVDTANQNLDTYVSTGITNAQNNANNQPCAGDGDDQFNAISATFQASAGVVTAAVEAMKSASADADNAIGVLVGALTGFVTSYASALEQLDQAQGEQFDTALQALHFDVSWDAWKTLAAAVTPQAQTMMRLSKPAPALV